MAITIQQAPQSFTPGFNDVIFVVSSNNTGQSNFQYVCDIYITDDTGALTFAGQTYLREKTPVDPVYSSGVFNIGRKIESFLSYDSSGITGAEKCPSSIIQVQCKFGEEYGASSAITVYPNLTTATTIQIWNGVMDSAEFKDYNVNNYISTGSTNGTRKFLTNRPSHGDYTASSNISNYLLAQGKIRSDENAWLYILANKISGNNTDIQYFKIEIFNSAGTLLKSYKIKNNRRDATTAGMQMIRFPAGTRNLQLIAAADFYTGDGDDAGPIVWASTYYKYQIWCQTATTHISETQWYLVDDSCTDYTVYRLHFLNKLGGFDSFSFIRAHTEETNITQRDSFKRNLITRIGGGQYGYNKTDLSDVNFYTRNKDSFKVMSDWISEDVSEWLEELVTSPVVFHDHPTHGLLAVNIKDTEHIRKQWVTDKLFNLEITFEYSTDRYRQRL